VISPEEEKEGYVRLSVGILSELLGAVLRKAVVGLHNVMYRNVSSSETYI